MPVFVVERRYADRLDVDADLAEGINRINDEEGVRWLYSFLAADKRKTHCLYEAPSAAAILRWRSGRTARRRHRGGDRNGPLRLLALHAYGYDVSAVTWWTG